MIFLTRVSLQFFHCVGMFHEVVVCLLVVRPQFFEYPVRVAPVGYWLVLECVRFPLRPLTFVVMVSISKKYFVTVAFPTLPSSERAKRLLR